MKIMTILGTRPEIIKLSRVMAALDDCSKHIIVHTGQNYDYELNEVFFEDLGIRKPDYFLNVAGNTMAETVGNIISKSDEVLVEVNPDALLVLGDTNSCLSVYPAKRRKIPIFHMEAGNRCFDFRVPEEINRKIVDHISDINLVYTEHARNYLMREGLPPDQIIKTGSPMKEILDLHKAAIEGSDVLSRLDLSKNEYFVASIHREENVDQPEHLQSLVQALNAIVEKHNQPLIFSCHPRTLKRLNEGNYTLDKRVRNMEPLGFFDYNHLQLHSICSISDSGGVTEDSSILGFPAITIRQAHERPEGMDEGVVIMSGLNPENILNSIALTIKQHNKIGPPRLPKDYDAPDVSGKVAKIIFSYTEYIRRVVWKEND